MSEIEKTGVKYRYYTSEGWNVLSMWTKASDVEFNGGGSLEDYISQTNAQLQSYGIDSLSLFNDSWNS